MTRKYKSSIRFDTPAECSHSLHMIIEYEQDTTQEEYDSMLEFYQRRLSQRYGRQIPREEISVAPKVGELSTVRTHIISEPGRPLNEALLKSMHQRAPYVLTRLLEELVLRQKANDLRQMDRDLLRDTVRGLTEILKEKKVN